jgi:hypothetical protein
MGPLVKLGNGAREAANSECFKTGEAVGLLVAAGASDVACVLLRYPWSNVLGDGLVGLEANNRMVLAAWASEGASDPSSLISSSYC